MTLTTSARTKCPGTALQSGGRGRRPARLGTDDTRIDVEEGRTSFQSKRSNEKIPRFSVNEIPYKSARRQSRAPNLKGPSPTPESHFGQEELGDVPWRSEDPHRYQIPKLGDSWHECHNLTEKYDNELCDAWKEEVDKLLIFAGLFSATVTAFVVESYKWLQEDSEDVSVRLLAFMATQLANTSTPLPIELRQQPFSVSASEVRINAVWFLSLTLALSTVLIGILCLQWLREYQRDAALSHKDAVALRQMRYEGLLYWRVPDILSILPILLQTSLVLFFFGLLELLWTRNIIVATFITAAVGIVMFFLAATTALPVLQYVFTTDPHLRVHQCPYKSPQSWLFYQIGTTFFLLLDSLHLWWWGLEESPSTRRLLKSRGDLNWLNFDMRWRTLRDAQEVVRGTPRKLLDWDDIVHGLQWLNATFSQSVNGVYPIHHALVDLDIPAAAATVSGLYLDGQIDNATLRVMLDDRFSPTESQKRDVLAAYYLHIHQNSHPTLKTSYIEIVIRILNSQEVPRPFYDWLSEILQEIVSSSPKPTQSEITVQILLCVKNVITRHRGLQILDIVVAWALLHRLLSPSFASIQEDSGVSISMNLNHLKLACGLFERFETWIADGKEIERYERVKLCAEGMLTVFSLSPNIAWLQSMCPEMSKAISLARALEVHLATMGGPAVVLMRERWWLDYWEAYTESDWNRLMQNFRDVDEAPV